MRECFNSLTDRTQLARRRLWVESVKGIWEISLLIGR